MDRSHQPVTSRQILSAMLLSGIMSFLTYRKFRACTAKSATGCLAGNRRHIKFG
jgi:hypothetical protein